MSSFLRSPAAPLLAALLWGGTFPLTTMALTHFDPVGLVVTRFLMAAALFSLALLTGQIPMPALDRDAWARILGGALFLCVVGPLGLVASQASVELSLVIAVSQLAPVGVLLAGAVQARSLPPRTVLHGAALSLAGAAWLFWGTESPVDLPDLALLLSVPGAVVAYMMLTADLCREHGPLPIVSLLISVGALALLPAAPTALAQMQTAPWPPLLAVMALSLLGTVLAYSLWFGALSFTPPGHLSAYLHLVPVVGMLGGALTDAVPPLQSWCALALIVTGVALTERRSA